MPTTAFEFRSIRDTRRKALTIRDMNKQMRAHADGTPSEGAVDSLQPPMMTRNALVA